ncbi:cupin domain-containing protein [Nocardiopsis xinjiangensis]|uniref:cupin domain-containing protein n=1 Tax=Nocardiopsis xinjiangensis TaxID=124285 RepID=UPI0003499977|nr:cupin domain-containing protein [Nocardiopsis xinjiangensis]
MSTPRFPGSTAVSRVRVYGWPASDGLHGGTPHVHTASTEAYLVTGGSGQVHTLTPEGTAEDPLFPGDVLWFGPGTVHRLVNAEDLELVVVMQNAGLPEAGDAVLTFPREILADPAAYTEAAALPSEAAEGELAEAARARRDLAMQGYRELVAAVREQGPRALNAFHRDAAALARPQVQRWQELWEQSVQEETERTRRQLLALAEGDPGIMGEATVVRTDPAPVPHRFGMCGRLHTWRPREGPLP